MISIGDLGINHTAVHVGSALLLFIGFGKTNTLNWNSFELFGVFAKEINFFTLPAIRSL